MKSHPRISLTKAESSEIEFFWYLRNKPYVFRYSLSASSVSWEDHVNWIMPIILGVSNKKLFLIRYGKMPVGQIRLDINENEAEISISVLSEFHGKGIAVASVNLMIKKIKNEQAIRMLEATVHKNNIASIGLFNKLRFKLDSKKGKWLKYKLDIHDD